MWVFGTIILRARERLRHIGVRHAHTGTEGLILTHDLHIRIIAKATSEILREDPRLAAHRQTSPSPRAKHI